jgi:hypothetical protein
MYLGLCQSIPDATAVPLRHLALYDQAVNSPVCCCCCYVCAQDEFYVLPHHASFQEAFAEGGCLSNFSQVWGCWLCVKEHVCVCVGGGGGSSSSSCCCAEARAGTDWDTMSET